MTSSICAACGRSDAGTWRVLAFAADVFRVPADAVPEGELAGYVDGHVPLCPYCLRDCQTCGMPIVTTPVANLLARLAALDGVHVHWPYGDPCDNATHERPGRIGTPPDTEPASAQRAR